MTADNVIAAAEAMTNEWCNADSERAKRRVDQLIDVNGHRLDTMPDSGSGWVRCHECGRVADIASDKYWSKVSCNQNRWIPEAKTPLRQYSNLTAARRDRKERLAICDKIPESTYILSQWEKERIERNKEEAKKKKEMRKRMNDERAKAAEMYEEERRAWQRIEGGGEDEAERRRAEESKM